MCKTFMKKVIKILSKNIKCFNKKWPIMILMGKIILKSIILKLMDKLMQSQSKEHNFNRT